MNEIKMKTNLQFKKTFQFVFSFIIVTSSLDYTSYYFKQRTKETSTFYTQSTNIVPLIVTIVICNSALLKNVGV